jgi:cytochrome c-type biogenesis protein CcmH
MTGTGFVLAAGVCLIVAAACAAWPLLRRRDVADSHDRRATNVDLYCQRVGEIERDRDAGRVSPELAESLIRELAATLLDDAAVTDSQADASGRSVWAAAIVVVAVAAISLTMYHKLGAYDAVQLGESAKVLREADADPVALGDLVVRLRTRVAATPGDLESWYLLGHTLMRLDDAAGAVSAFEHVYSAEPDDASVQVALAQARFVADRGTVTDDNRALIDRILTADPQQAVALEILALDAFRKTDYASAARYLQNAIAGGSAGARTEALKQGLERARTLLGDAAGPSLDVTVDFGDALRGLPPTAALFVSARKPGERMPLLVARQPVDAATMTVRLDRTNAMQGDVTLREGETLNVAVRVSASGALSVGADDPHANQDGVTLTGGVTPVRLALGMPAASAATSAAPTSKRAAADVAVRLNVALAPGIETNPSARVYVIARAPQGPPVPIAVRSLDPMGLPEQLVLTDRDAMQPNRVLSMFDRVEVLARLSRSGNPMRQPGDVESAARVLDPRSEATIELIIGG